MRLTLSSFSRPIIFLPLISIFLFFSPITEQIDKWLYLEVLLAAGSLTSAYALVRRSRTRSNAYYHLATTILSSFSFYWSMNVIVGSDPSIILLSPYVTGAVLGVALGFTCAKEIEKKISSVVDIGIESGVKQSQPIRPILAICIPILLIQFAAKIQNPEELLPLLAIIGLAMMERTVFSALSIFRSTDHHGLHFTAALLHALAEFTLYFVMVKGGMDWALFIPYMMGSSTGDLLGMWAGKKIERKFKASVDGHVIGKKKIVLPILPTITALLLLIPHLALFGLFALSSWIALAFVALLSNAATTISSRAAQRNHLPYLEWASIGSNGIWFLSFYLRVAGRLAPHLLLPYMSGMIIGSMWGQTIAMNIEKRIGAFMIDPVQKPKSA